MRKNREEEQNQVAFVTWFRTQHRKYADLLTLGSFGENVGPKRMHRLKQMGLTPGYPDLFLAVAMGERIVTDIGDFWATDLTHGLFIEMKTKLGRITEDQSHIHVRLRQMNYKVEIARSWEEAKQIIEEYLS